MNWLSGVACGRHPHRPPQPSSRGGPYLNLALGARHHLYRGAVLSSCSVGWRRPSVRRKERNTARGMRGFGAAERLTTLRRLHHQGGKPLLLPGRSTMGPSSRHRAEAVAARLILRPRRRHGASSKSSRGRYRAESHRRYWRMRARHRAALHPGIGKRDLIWSGDDWITDLRGLKTERLAEPLSE